VENHLQALKAKLRPLTRRGGLLALAGMGLAGAAAIAQYKARQAERSYPPQGRFMTARGVRLHY
jgi:hypothetical protein